jgi:hypothetical protein
MNKFSSLPRNIKIASLTVIVLCCSIFLILAFHPFPHSEKGPISPTLKQYGGDIWFYEQAIEKYSHNIGAVVDEYKNFYQNLFSAQRPKTLVPGPLYPALLAVFDYREQHTLPLAVFYLLLGIVLSLIWINWFHRLGLSLPGLLMFACMPHLIWLSIYISTDLIYALFFAIFYIALFRNLETLTLGGQRWRVYTIYGAAVLMTLTRPTSLSINFYLVFILVFYCRKLIRQYPVVTVLFVLFSMASVLYYLPYFLLYADGPQKIYGVYGDIVHYGLPSSLAGVAPFLGKVIFVLTGKIFYMVGLNPSANGLWYALALRALYAIPMLVGLVYIFIKESPLLKWLVFFTILPLLIGSVLLRYAFPIQPLLFCYGFMVIANQLSLAKEKLKIAVCR